MAAAIGRVYNQAFDRSPAGTLAVTNGLLSGVADIVAQGAQIGMAYRQSKEQENEKPNPYMAPPARVQIPEFDLVRTGRFIIFGTMMGPILARWNHFLEHRFPLRPLSAQAAASKEASKGAGAPVENVQRILLSSSGGVSRGKVSITALAKRVGADQAVMAPLGLTIFLGSMGIMEGHSLPAIQQKYVDLFPPAIKANWTVWPIIQVVNFRFMPLPYRVPFQATCGVFWTLYLSLLNSSKATAVEAEVKDLKRDTERVAQQKRAAVALESQ